MSEQLQAMLQPITTGVSANAAGDASFHMHAANPQSRAEFERLYYSPNAATDTVATDHVARSSSMMQRVSNAIDGLAAEQGRVDLLANMELHGLGVSTNGQVDSAARYERLLMVQKAINEQAARVQLANSCASGVQGCVQTLVQRGQ